MIIASVWVIAEGTRKVLDGPEKYETIKYLSSISSKVSQANQSTAAETRRGFALEYRVYARKDRRGGRSQTLRNNT